MRRKTLSQADSAMNARQMPKRQREAQREVDEADGQQLADHAEPAQAHGRLQAQPALARLRSVAVRTVQHGCPGIASARLPGIVHRGGPARPWAACVETLALCGLLSQIGGSVQTADRRIPPIARHRRPASRLPRPHAKTDVAEQRRPSRLPSSCASCARCIATSRPSTASASAWQAAPSRPCSVATAPARPPPSPC